MLARIFIQMGRDGRVFALVGAASLLTLYGVVIATLSLVESVTVPWMRARAEDDARTYGRAMGLSRPSATCQSTSTDDGFVRCAVTDGARVVAVECRASYVLDYERGCAPMRAVGVSP